jgi:hypothetical protein
MVNRLADLALRVHILKKAARLQLRERLRYLLLCRRVHTALIPLWVAVCGYSAFIATCCIYPHFAVVIHLDAPANEATPDLPTFLLFSTISLLCGLGVLVVLATRRMLSEYWFLNFFVHYGRRSKPNC